MLFFLLEKERKRLKKANHCCFCEFNKRYLSGIPRPDAGYFCLGTKVTKSPPKPHRFRTSRLAGARAVRQQKYRHEKSKNFAQDASRTLRLPARRPSVPYPRKPNPLTHGRKLPYSAFRNTEEQGTPKQRHKHPYFHDVAAAWQMQNPSENRVPQIKRARNIGDHRKTGIQGVSP